MNLQEVGDKANALRKELHDVEQEYRRLAEEERQKRIAKLNPLHIKLVTDRYVTREEHEVIMEAGKTFGKICKDSGVLQAVEIQLYYDGRAEFEPLRLL